MSEGFETESINETKELAEENLSITFEANDSIFLSLEQFNQKNSDKVFLNFSDNSKDQIELKENLIFKFSETDYVGYTFTKSGSEMIIKFISSYKDNYEVNKFWKDKSKFEIFQNSNNQQK
jgi:hypothetical protein